MIARIFTRRTVSIRQVLAALIALVAIGIALPAPAPAQAPQPSAASLLIAKQIVELKGVKAMMDPIPSGVVEKAKGVFMQANFMWQKDINESAAIVHKDFDGRSSELVDATARIYASHFTEAELKQILAFYQSPVGQKMIVEEPKVIGESMENAQKWADDVSVDVINKMRAEMKKRGHDM
jgi:hypothetical protein